MASTPSPADIEKLKAVLGPETVNKAEVAVQQHNAVAAGGARRKSRAKRRGGAECSAEELALYKVAIGGIALATTGYAAAAIGASVLATATGFVTSIAGTLTDTCTGYPLQGAPVQRAICGGTSTLVDEVASIIKDQNISTVKAVVTGAAAVTLWQSVVSTVKAGVSGANANLDKIAEYVCKKIHERNEASGKPPRSDAASQTDSQVPAGQPSIVDAFAQQRKRRGSTAGGRRKTRKGRSKKMGKSRRRTSRTPLFIY
jgi:hypothetical protein